MPFKMFWGSLRLLFGAPGGFLGALWVLLGRLDGSPNVSKRFIWAPLSSHLGPRGALNNPKQLPKRPDGEGEGPTKPPKAIWKRISTYVPTSHPQKL